MEYCLVKSGKRRTLCPSCFGQGTRYYLADATGRQTLHVTHYDTEDVWGFCGDSVEEFETFCTGIEGANAYIQQRVCRECGGTGWSYADHWRVRFKKRCAPARFASTYGLFIVYKNPFEYVDQENIAHYKDQFHLAAEIAYEIPKLDAKVNRMHRRAQKAEGKVEHLEHLYKKARAEANRLRKTIREVSRIKEGPLGSRVPKTVRTKQRRD